MLFNSFSELKNLTAPVFSLRQMLLFTSANAKPTESLSLIFTMAIFFKMKSSFC